ncbi:hypothetical protein RHGRI_007536 [Rhododendron griersonianum]|uniref:Uncharacterized protein n=1 Tax=Rhododendron griersonianum TaxID=479676 RepID=A0AAV6KXF0_9ERIC|nr:hypothetical protein RHGRI_007536 [Rhododendron griersonianum]
MFLEVLLAIGITSTVPGVTTIARGSKTPGHADGRGRNASFSPDFELAFIPERFALMVCDHGHKLVRQINLKSEDCARGSHSGAQAKMYSLFMFSKDVSHPGPGSFFIGGGTNPMFVLSSFDDVTLATAFNVSIMYQWLNHSAM